MPENPYASPEATHVDPASAENRQSNSLDWGKVAPLWNLGYLFGSVWVVGSLLMYGALVGLMIVQHGELGYRTTPHHYDLAGYLSFITCSLVALAVGTAWTVKRRQEFRRDWPNWKLAAISLIVSSLIMLPAWVAFDLIIYRAVRKLPIEPEWIGIAISAALGMVQGYLCQHGVGTRFAHRWITRTPQAQSMDQPTTSDSHLGM
jgi:hypothetical protein